MTDHRTTAPTEPVAPHPVQTIAMPSPPPHLDLAGLSYAHVYAGLPGARWRSLVAVVVTVIGFVIVTVVASVAAIAVEGPPKVGRVSPLLLVATALGLASLTPLAMLTQRVLLPGAISLSSVGGRFRWALLGSYAVIVVPLTIVYMTAFTWFTLPAGSSRGSDWLGFALVGILVLPWQAAGEEYGFRGLISRAAAAWSLKPTVALVLGAVVSTAAFTAAHVAADPWLNAYYVVFGLSMVVVARMTGGLEGPVLLHATNNVTATVVGALWADLGSMFERSAGAAGPFMLVQMMFVLGTSALMVVVARRRAVRVTV